MLRGPVQYICTARRLLGTTHNHRCSSNSSNRLYTQNSHLQLVRLFLGFNMLNLFTTICHATACQVQSGGPNLARHGKVVLMLSWDHLLPLARHLVWAPLMPSASVPGRPLPLPWPVGAQWKLLILWQFMFCGYVCCWHDVLGWRAADGSTGWG